MQYLVTTQKKVSFLGGIDHRSKTFKWGAELFVWFGSNRSHPP